MIILQQFDIQSKCILEVHGDPKFLDLPKEERNLNNLYNQNMHFIDRDENEGPAIIHRIAANRAHRFYGLLKEGDIYAQKYYKAGKLHRINGPAEIIEAVNSGTYKRECYYQNNYIMNENGPVVICTDINGTISYTYQINGKMFHTINILLTSKEEMENYLILQ